MEACREVVVEEIGMTTGVVVSMTETVAETVMPLSKSLSRHKVSHFSHRACILLVALPLQYMTYLIVLIFKHGMLLQQQTQESRIRRTWQTQEPII